MSQSHICDQEMVTHAFYSRVNDSGDIFVLEINVFAAFNPGSVMSKLTSAAGISHQEFWGAMVKKALGRVPNSNMKMGA